MGARSDPVAHRTCHLFRKHRRNLLVVLRSADAEIEPLQSLGDAGRFRYRTALDIEPHIVTNAVGFDDSEIRVIRIEFAHRGKEFLEGREVAAIGLRIFRETNQVSAGGLDIGAAINAGGFLITDGVTSAATINGGGFEDNCLAIYN